MMAIGSNTQQEWVMSGGHSSTHHFRDSKPKLNLLVFEFVNCWLTATSCSEEKRPARVS